MESMRAAAVRVLLHCCAQDLERILRCNAPGEEHLALPLSAIALANHEPELAAGLYARPLEVLTLLDEATIPAQLEMKAAIEQGMEGQQAAAAVGGGAGQLLPVQCALNVCDNVHVRLVSLPTSLDPHPSPMRPPLARLGCSQLHQLLYVNGTVVRGGPVRVWESIQFFECSRCKEKFPLKSSLNDGGAVDMPDACPLAFRNQPCPGTKFKKVPGASIYSGFQELRLQAATACLGLGEPPASVTVVLQDELADSVRPGDSVDVVGVLVPRWLSTAPGRRCELELVLVANNITRAGGLGRAGGPAAAVGGLPALWDAAPPGSGTQSLPELAALFEDFWKAHESTPMMGRNKILAGVCPGVAGLLPVKLSALLVLVGGVARREEGCSNIRGELHLLMLGDPGTGKSQIMKWACRASPGRAVLTTGRGSSGAGLTVAATRDGNSWALEAGALVLADGGLCCIDEFDGIRSQERAVIHEAMEQQTVHVAKAGLVTNLSTRTAIIGAINPRPGTTVTCGRALTEVTGLEGPLLSRFDLVLLLADPRHPDWDRVVAGHVLARGGASARSTEGSNDPELSGSSAAAATSAAAAGSPAGYLALPAPGDLKAPLPPVTLVAAPAIDEVLCSMNQRSQPGTCSASSFREPSIAERIAARLSSSTTGVNLGDCHPSQAPTQPAPKTQTANCNVTPAASAAASGNSASSAWTVDVIRAYIAWVRSRPPPVMTHEAERVLVAYYSALRRAEERSTARSTIRALESLIRISQAHARLMCSDQVLLRDSVVAVVLADSSQQLLAIPGADSITNARFPDDPDGELFMQQQVVLMRLQLASLLPAALPGVTASG